MSSPPSGPSTVDTDPSALAQRILGLLGDRRRLMVGLAGGPGSGKSTLAAALADILGAQAVVVPMDGFHLAQSVLVAQGTAGVKGAPHTFDAAGYVALLARLRTVGDDVVYAPTFDRGLEEPIGSSIPVRAEHRVVLTEGNYLLLDDPPWNRVRPLLDQVWYLDPGEPVRVDRLVARHMSYGRSESDARRRALTGSDGSNNELVSASRHRADLVLRG